MKSFLFYIAGVLSAVLVLVLIGLSNQSGQLDGLTIFSDKGECISKKQFKVFQVLAPDAALASELSDEQYMWFHGTIVLIVNDEGKHYYDDEMIKIPAKKCARQIGTYKYRTKDDMYKTVPVVSID